MSTVEAKILPLEAVGFARWFDVGPRPPDLDDAIRRLEAVHRPSSSKMPFRFVALDAGGEVRAKLGGYVTTSGRLTFWSVYHRSDADEGERRRHAVKLVSTCVAHARATPAVSYVETRPAHDTPDAAVLLDVLRSEGLYFVAAAHFFEGPTSPHRTSVRCGPSGVRLMSYRDAAPDAVIDVFARVQTDTLDRVEREHRSAPEATIEELREIAGAAAMTPLWRIATLNRVPVGFVLCGDVEARGDDPPTVTVLEIGVVPEARGQGLGRRLLTSALEEAARRGARAVTALIDDVNTPSIRLHESCGLTRLPGEFGTWRCDIRRP